MESNKINHEGKVVKITDNKVYAEIVVSEACGSCQAKQMCFHKGKALTVESQLGEGQEFQVGENVNVYFTPKLATSSVILAYVAPLALFMAVMFSLIAITGSQDVGCIAALCTVPLYYYVLYLTRDKLKRKFVFNVEHRFDE